MYYIIIKSPGASTFFLKSLLAVEIFHFYPGRVYNRYCGIYDDLDNRSIYCIHEPTGKFRYKLIDVALCLNSHYFLILVYS